MEVYTRLVRQKKTRRANGGKSNKGWCNTSMTTRIVCPGVDECQDTECCFKQRIRLPSHGCAHCWTVEQEAAYHAKRAEQETERMERDKVAAIANAEYQERKQAEKEAMDTRQAAHLSKIHRNDQLDAGNKAGKRAVKRQEINDKQRHSEQENRRMDRVDARYVDSEPSAVDVENPFESLRVHLTGEVDLTPTPSLLETESGNPLIYSGKVTGVYSEHR